MLSDDAADGVSCSLMSVPALGSAGREWASGAERSRAAASAPQLQEGSVPQTLPGPRPPRRAKPRREASTSSTPQIHQGNLPNFLHP